MLSYEQIKTCSTNVINSLDINKLESKILIDAIVANDIRVVDSLLKLGMDPSINSNNAIRTAALHSSQEIFEMLLSDIRTDPFMKGRNPGEIEDVSAYMWAQNIADNTAENWALKMIERYHDQKCIETLN